MAKALFGLLFICFFLKAMTASFKEGGGEYHPGFVTPEMGKYDDERQDTTASMGLFKEPCFLDVAVLIDVSKSMNKTERGQLNTIFEEIVDNLRVSQDGSHMAIITFGSHANLTFTFSDKTYRNADALKKKAKEAIVFEPDRQGTRTDLAEKLAVEKVFTKEGGDREKFRNVMIILTDGFFWVANWDKTPKVDFFNTTETLKAKGVKIIVVGIGSEDELEKADNNLTTVAGNDGTILKYTSFGEFHNKLDDLLKEVCGCRIDVAFIIDSSDTVGKAAFEDAKKLVKDMVTYLKLGLDDSRVALVLFADIVEVKAQFSDNYGVKELQDIVQSLSSIGSRTRIDKALLKTEDVFSLKTSSERHGAYKMAVVLTDGVQNEDHDTKSLRSSSQLLRKSGVRVIAVGIGARKDKNLLRLMTDSMEDVKMNEEDEALKYFQELNKKLNQNSCVPPTPKIPVQPVCKDVREDCAGRKKEKHSRLCDLDYGAAYCRKTCELCYR